MKIAIASDHAGFILKKALLRFLKNKNIEVLDFGVHQADSVDYPDFAVLVASEVSKKQVDVGILICGTGNGMAMTANKFRGVRAAVAHDVNTAMLAKQHNNANVLALGARVLGQTLAEKVIEIWLDTDYDGGRHDGRIQKIEKIEHERMK